MTHDCRSLPTAVRGKLPGMRQLLHRAWRDFDLILPTTFLKCVGIGTTSSVAFCVLYYVAFEIFVQPHVPAPIYSHGQLAGMMLYLCAVLGAIAGMSVGLAFRSSWWLAGMCSCLAASLSAAFVTDLWNSSLNKYGPDTSNLIVFVPPMAVSAACYLLGAMLIVLAVAKSIRSLWITCVTKNPAPTGPSSPPR